MRFLLLCQSGLATLLGALIAHRYGSNQAESFIAGALVILLNLIFLVLVWPSFLAKKQFALSSATGVFKYAILGWILYSIAQLQTLRIEWFALGLSTVLFSVIATALWDARAANGA